MEGNEFVFDYVRLLYYEGHKINLKGHKINQNGGGSYIDSRYWV